MATRVGLALSAAVLALTSTSAVKAVPEEEPFTGPVARATCRAGDLVETGVQGQVPLLDRLNGRAADGYNCNLDLIASVGDTTGTPTDPAGVRPASGRGDDGLACPP